MNLNRLFLVGFPLFALAMACSSKEEAAPQPQACIDLGKCCPGVSPVLKSNCDTIASGTSEGLCKATFLTYCVSDAGSGSPDSSGGPTSTGSSNDAGSDARDCAALQKQCDACEDATARGQCYSVVDTKDAANCSQTLASNTFDTAGSTCKP